MPKQLPHWKIDAWLLPPGEFPIPMQRSVYVHAEKASDAIKEALTQLGREGINPEVVKIVRLSPPFNTYP